MLMHVLALVLLAVAVPGTARQDPPAAAPSAEATIDRLAWLAGSWGGTLGTSRVEEHWTAPAGGSMLAVARTVRDDRLRAFEFLRIVERGGTLVYLAMPNGRSPATEFTLTKIDEASATFENPAHDFPKVIRYSLGPGGVLEAAISGDAAQKPTVFTLTRIPPLTGGQQSR